MNIHFTVPETNIIAMYRRATKSQTIENIMDNIPLFDDAEMKEIAENVIIKLDKITDGEFENEIFIAEYGKVY